VTMDAEKSRQLFDGRRVALTLPSQPGVYRMLNDSDEVLYVGKARNLRKRVSSYFRKNGLGAKTRALVHQVRRIEVTVTHTETEALILENHLIKAHRPRYNILLRDDKSYPYIYLSSGHDYPRLSFYRGSRREEGRFFGPYPSASAVRDTLNSMQKLFRVRQCEDTFFSNRSRPCLQYQIKRCTAPCVGLIDPAGYREDVRHAIMFLEGKDQELVDELIRRMEAASANLAYEQAAHYRDQISNLRRIQEKQHVSGEKGDLDIVAAVVHGGFGCVQVVYVRQGRILGDKAFFPQLPFQSSAADLLIAFLPQYYLVERDIPKTILINEQPADRTVVAQTLSQAANKKINLLVPHRGERARWLAMAVSNAESALARHLASRSGMQQRLIALQEALDLDSIPQRIECFDISHTHGEATVASCIVFDRDGAVKSDYRRFNIHEITPGDDYAAMYQALSRRYRKLREGEGKVPDLLLIDGGKGQVKQAENVIEELQITGLLIVGIAKGPARKPGQEILHISRRRTPLQLSAESAALHLIQQIRDEAHRFAITGHRQQRGKQRSRSSLERIEGVGPRRRRVLLRQFGGLQGVARAGVEDLASVKGISKALAKRIYSAFHIDQNGSQI